MTKSLECNLLNISSKHSYLMAIILLGIYLRAEVSKLGPASHPFFWIKFYCHIAMSICFHTVIYECFLATKAEVSTCDRDYLWATISKIFTIWPIIKKIADSWPQKLAHIYNIWISVFILLVLTVKNYKQISINQEIYQSISFI